uniref:WD repeat domain-containing protein 83 n=2 Tax=Passeriformes TaxID=9126 RepID=A0A8C3NSJ2_GEOPR
MAFPRPRPARPELPRQRVQSLQCGQGAVRAARFNADGNYCLTCGSDKTLKLWNPHKGTALRTYQGHGYEVLDAAGSFDNSQICSGGADKAVALWDVSTGQVVRKYRGHAGVRRGPRGQLGGLGVGSGEGDLGPCVRIDVLISLLVPQKVNCVQFNEEATVIVSGSIDSTVRCWDCRSRRPDPIQVLDEAKDGISSVKLSAHEILTGSVDGRVRRYDLRTGQLCSDYIGSPITSVCFSKDGQCVLAASLDSTLRLLDKDTGELLGEYTGHRSTTYRLDCVLNELDTHVGCASEDGHVYFWDLLEVSEGPQGGFGDTADPPDPPGVPAGFSGAQAARGPGRGAVPGLPPRPALPAGGHAGPGDAVARGHLPARGGPRHLRGTGGSPVTRGINPHGDPAVLYWELE